MGYNPNDFYFKKAKKEGFVARSAYKLEEIQKKHKLIRAADHVLDLGCAPGAWSQLAVKLVGHQGFVEGIDLKPVQIQYSRARFLVKNVFDLKAEDLMYAPYDVVISDMAPQTTGHKSVDQAQSEQLCLRVLEVIEVWLKPNGHMAMKYFMGGGTKSLENEVKKRFEQTHFVRPSATRKESKEIFIVGLHKK